MTSWFSLTDFQVTPKTIFGNVFHCCNSSRSPLKQCRWNLISLHPSWVISSKALAATAPSSVSLQWIMAGKLLVLPTNSSLIKTSSWLDRILVYTDPEFGMGNSCTLWYSPTLSPYSLTATHKCPSSRPCNSRERWLDKPLLVT